MHQLSRATRSRFGRWWNVGGFGSRHAGGAQVLKANGSVTFISENIASDVWHHLGHRADGELPAEY